MRYIHLPALQTRQHANHWLNLTNVSTSWSCPTLLSRPIALAAHNADARPRKPQRTPTRCEFGGKNVSSPQPYLDVFINIVRSCRLATDVGSVIARELDMPTLMSWRATCRATYTSTTGTLRRSLKALLHRFNPWPREFLRLVTECRALMGGEFALAFLLRDTAFQPLFLDIFVSNRYFQTLVEHFLFSPLVSMHMTFEGVYTTTPPFSRHRDIRRFALFRSHGGRPIRVYDAQANDAIAR